MSSRPPRTRRLFRRKKDYAEDLLFPEETRLPKKSRINRVRKGIFVIPSLLTLMSIFLSFYAIVSSINGNFLLAALLILAAGFFDGLDGRVARLTKTTTRFGLELDSLADVISFGVAPALLMYLWALDALGRVGWASAFVFVSCGALRLARFNVQTGYIDPKRFQGLPIPMAAAMICTTVLFFDKTGIQPVDHRVALVALTYALAFLMVTGVKFHAFKDLALLRQKPFSFTVAFVLILALIAVFPFVVPFFICAAYVLSGPILTISAHVRRKRQSEAEAETEDPSPEAEEADAQASS
jgi:CDP-diacylglycerol--serine O-phosphatidyltransferase